MFDPAAQLRAARVVRAFPGDTFLRNMAATGRTCRWHFKNFLRAVAEFFFDLHDGRDDFAGFFDENGVADADVFALDFLLVVEGRARDRAAGDKDGLKLCNRGERAGAADLDGDVQELGFGALGFVFVGDRPAGGFGGGSEFAAQGEAVELYDRAVGFVGKIMAHVAHLLDGAVDGILVRALENLLRNRESPFLKFGKHLAPCGGLLSSPCACAVKNGREFAGGGDGGVELLDGASGSISGICKGRQALLVAFGVEAFKNGFR